MNKIKLKSTKRILFVLLFATAMSRAIMSGDLWTIIVSAIIVPAIIVLDVLENRKAQ